MNVAVVGTGNVGWALAAILSQQKFVDRVLVSSRSVERVEALSMDIGSANPTAFEKVCSAQLEELFVADVVVLTSGVQMRAGETAADVRAANIEVTRKSLLRMKLKPSTILVTLATPVDDITIFAQLLTGLPHRQVFGFGGDLDRNRLEYVLRRRNIFKGEIELVGEHGGNAIPVYPGEEQYLDVAKEVRGFLRRVTTLAGETRNLSTALLISRLIESLALNLSRTHYLCGYHQEHEVYLTWGFPVDRSGIGVPNQIGVLGKARVDLEELIIKRKKTTNELMALI